MLCEHGSRAVEPMSGLLGWWGPFCVRESLRVWGNVDDRLNRMESLHLTRPECSIVRANLKDLAHIGDSGGTWRPVTWKGRRFLEAE